MKALKVLSAASHVVYFSFILDFLDKIHICEQLFEKEYCFIISDLYRELIKLIMKFSRHNGRNNFYRDVL